MGFETFRVELRGGKAKFAEADETVRKLPHMKPDPHSLPTKGSTYYLFEDGLHAIELELMESPVKLSCRFTLCHPPSVDAVFLGLVRDLMSRLGMTVRICDDVPSEHAGSFPIDEFSEFSAIASRAIAARRVEWIGAFGDKPLAATTNEVYQRIIVPRCQPRVEQTSPP